VTHFSPVLFLKRFGMSATDLEGPGTTTVSREFLRALIGELVARMPFDEDWYSRNYSDVEAAYLAGDIQSLHEHFKTTGYLDGRLPAEFPFDAAWYRSYYKDVAKAYPPSDLEGMRTHYLELGYFEGRAGTAEMLAEVRRWQILARG
jgi:hypothetical protein